MKRILVLLLGFGLVATASLAAAPEKNFELGLNGGVAIATNSGYDLGFGGQVTGLYLLDGGVGIGLGIGFNTFNVTGSTSTDGASGSDLSFLATLKYAFGTDKTKPYILVDAGLSSWIDSITVSSLSLSTSTIYPEFGGGVGVQFPAGDNLNIFLQATANVIVATGSTFTYIPVDAGVNFDI